MRGFPRWGGGAQPFSLGQDLYRKSANFMKMKEIGPLGSTNEEGQVQGQVPDVNCLCACTSFIPLLIQKLFVSYSRNEGFISPKGLHVQIRQTSPTHPFRVSTGKENIPRMS